jgi:5-methylcytosine-specific restriction endonuclease McrA
LWPWRPRVQVSSLTPVTLDKFGSFLERLCYNAAVGSAAWRQANANKVRGYWRAWYYRNRAAVSMGRRRRKADIRQFLREYKATLACADCGEGHPATLDFHHLNPAEKERSLGDIGKQGWSRKKVIAEIAKCVTLCANCHRKRHWIVDVFCGDDADKS